MEAVLFIKDTLDVAVMHDSLSVGKVYLANDSATIYKSCMGCAELGNNSAVLIVGLICLTIVLLVAIIVGLFFYHKRELAGLKAEAERKLIETEKKRRENEHKLRIEEERSLYRKRLLNFLELRGKEGEYVLELKNFIKSMLPTDQEGNSTGKPIDSSNPPLVF